MRRLSFLTRAATPHATFCDACSSVCDARRHARAVRSAAADLFAARLPR